MTGGPRAPRGSGELHPAVDFGPASAHDHSVSYLEARFRPEAVQGIAVGVGIVDDVVRSDRDGSPDLATVYDDVIGMPKDVEPCPGASSVDECHRSRGVRNQGRGTRVTRRLDRRE
jgi:hypothetical protein